MMKTLTNCIILCMIMTISVMANSFSNSTAEVNQDSFSAVADVNEPSDELTTRQITQDANSEVKKDIDLAKKSGNPVFLVVTESNSPETEKALSIARNAKAIQENAEVIQMDREETANAELVKELRLATAPVPLIIVLSSDGTPVGGFLLNQATPELLVSKIPTPKLEEVYATIKDRKTALVVFTKPSMTDRNQVLEACQDAVTKLNENAVIVEVNMDDKKEEKFLKQMRINKATNSSTTLVINTQGQVAGTSKTVPDASKLAAAATQPVRGGCGPGCGPKGCGK